MKQLLLSTAVLAASALAVAAQDSPFRTGDDPTAVRASEFIGKRIYASEAALDADEYDGVQEGWDDIGEVNDVVLARDGSAGTVLVDIGGFLGVGERQVAVDMAAIRFVADGATADDLDDYFLVLNADRATLEGAPAWMSSEATGDDPAEATADDATETATADTTAEPKTDTMTEAAPAREPMVRDGYEALDRTAMTTEDLTGAPVYDANDERVGEVGELILDDGGQITTAVVDVGGFLGIGEKPVALTLADLDILRQSGGPEVRVYVSMTKDELEALPVHGG